MKSNLTVGLVCAGVIVQSYGASPPTSFDDLERVSGVVVEIAVVGFVRADGDRPLYFYPSEADARAGSTSRVIDVAAEGDQAVAFKKEFEPVGWVCDESKSEFDCVRSEPAVQCVIMIGTFRSYDPDSIRTGYPLSEIGEFWARSIEPSTLCSGD